MAKKKKEDPEIVPRGESTSHLSGMYQDWFLDYASYVILERAIPSFEDGLKPVQRRILHALKTMDDGRFHKVANVIGQTMQYHPHGDQAIGDALVNLGQKDLLIETQGNWGDVRTGDRAAAPRYIEARLSKFALEVAFNKEITEWQLSYDGRKSEPVHLPMKFPLILQQGVEGIAVGLATKILPHNFIELCKASIQNLKGRTVKIYPDFPNGGVMDCSDYQQGLRGGKIKVRADIEVVDRKTIAVRSVPYGTTTTSLIDSIVKANDKGKIKIKQVVDNTAKDVEVLITLHAGTSPELTVDALYAFTDCEISISPNCCVIVDDKPVFIPVHELLRNSTENTKELLKRELEIKLGELEDKWHFSSLEKIFIENRIYRRIEESETWESVISEIDQGLEPFKKLFKREITEEDITRLTEIRIKRISKYDSFKADEAIKRLEDQIKEIKHNLKNLTDYAIAYFERLMEKYGKDRERKTQIKEFDTIQVKAVATANRKLYVNRKEGFVGYGLKKDEFVADCSDVDDVIAFTKHGTCTVTRVGEKSFVGKDILHVALWQKGNDRMVYNMIYSSPKEGRNYAKRFAVTAVTRDKPIDLVKGDPKAKVIHLTANPNGEAESISVKLSPNCKAKKKVFDYSFADLEIKGRASKGNILSRWPISKITITEQGESTLEGINVWLDTKYGKLSNEETGKFLGAFEADDKILSVYQDGTYLMTTFDTTTRYDVDKLLAIAKYNDGMVIGAVYWHAEKKAFYVKRFQIETTALGQRFQFIDENSKSKLSAVSLSDEATIQYKLKKKSGSDKEITFSLESFVGVKGWKSIGNKLGGNQIKGIKVIEEKNVQKDATAIKPSASDNIKEGNKVRGKGMIWDLDGDEEDKEGKLF